ncbi:hypothetical protein VTK56DRAFT_6172 [Thermocarpiscus australiensis]
MRVWCASGPRCRRCCGSANISVATIVADGGQDRGGWQLVSWVMGAGVPHEDITVSVGTWCYSAPEDREAWSDAMIQKLRDGQMRTKALELGITTEEEIEGMIRAWGQWSRTDDATLGIMNGEVIVQRE